MLLAGPSSRYGASESDSNTLNMSQLEDTKLNAIAHQMLIDYDARNPGTAFSDGLCLGVDDAWRLQGVVAHLRAQRGEKVVGFKIGCVCEHNQRQMGLSHPVWGRLWSTEQHGDGVQLRKKDFANVAIEAEFAITLEQSIDPANRIEQIEHYHRYHDMNHRCPLQFPLAY